MLMDLTILGGSAAAPNPNDASAGYLVRSGGTTLLVDCGSGVVSRLRQHCDPRALTAVLISHLHSDHVLDLVTLRYYLQYAPPGPQAPLPLYLPPGGIAFLEQLSAAFARGNEQTSGFWDSVFAPREYSDYLEAETGLLLEDLSVQFAPMVHYIPTWAMRFTESVTEHSLTYSADTGPTSTLAGFAADCDLLLCEATLLQQVGNDPAAWGHLTAAEAGQIATAANVRHLVLTHLWTELGLPNYLAAAQATFAGPVDLARTGLSFTTADPLLTHTHRLE